MWQAQIDSATSDPDAKVARVAIKYFNNDGRNDTVIERVSEPGTIKQIVQNGINERNRRDAIDILIANPPIGEVVLAPVPPSDTELALQEYQKGRQALIESKQDLDLGIIDQATYDDLVVELKKIKP